VLKEFRDFAMRGNVLDLAVGVVLGASFGTIVKSLVDDVIMPPLGLLIGGVDFSNIFITLKAGAKAAPPYATLADAKAAGATTMNLGVFVNTIISFLIIALAIFLVVRAANRLMAQKEAKPAPPPEPTKSEVLLTEIRDAIKARP
jgi:large conductance mechanosensitive channel